MALSCWACSGDVMCFLLGTDKPMGLSWVLNKRQAIYNIQNCDSYINIPSSRTKKTRVPPWLCCMMEVDSYPCLNCIHSRNGNVTWTFSGVAHYFMIKMSEFSFTNILTLFIRQFLTLAPDICIIRTVNCVYNCTCTRNIVLKVVFTRVGVPWFIERVTRHTS
jgi:hypothetical protein